MLAQRSPVASFKCLTISASIGNEKHISKRNERVGRTPAQAKSRALNITSTPSIISSPTTQSLPALEPLSQQDALALLSVASLGFALLAGDLVLWHKLQWLDQGVHHFVQDHVDLNLHNLARNAISNTPIVLGICGWVAAAATLTVSQLFGKEIRNSKEGKSGRHLAIATAMYAWCGGAVWHGDVWLVNILKQNFHRIRPNESFTSFAFPSGHATAATFIIGTLLYVILPALAAESRLGDSGAPLEKVKQWRLLLWPGLVGVTASGRVLADVHWTSDVMAGACLGSGLVAVTVLLCNALDRMIDGMEVRQKL